MFDELNNSMNIYERLKCKKFEFENKNFLNLSGK